MSNLEHLAAAKEAAWRRYNAIQRSLPQCPHVQKWLQDIGQASREHQTAVRAWSRAQRQETADVAPVALKAVPVAEADVPVIEGQGDLSELWEVAS